MKLQVLIGNIASGKSTYCKNAARSGIICLNDDAIVNMLHGNEYTLYDPKLKILYKSVENNIIETALSLQKIVLIDRGLNVSLHGRKRWIALAQSFDMPIEAIVFKLEEPEIHAHRRFDSDARGLDFLHWKKVAEKFSAEYVEPKLEEGFDKVNHISFKEIQEGFCFL